MKKPISILSALYLLLASNLSVSALANSVAYNQGSAAYSQTRFDNLSKDLTGFEFSGDYLLNPKVLLEAGLGIFSISGIDLTLTQFGGRYVHNLDSTTDVLLGADLYISSTKVSGASSSSTDIGLHAGVKRRHSQVVQLLGEVNLVKGNFGIEGGALYFFKKDMAARGLIGINDGSLSFTLGGSFFF